jgi:hypothetical protein
MAYFPNGCAGEILDNQCSECKLPDDAPCPILFVQMTYNYDQIGDDGEETQLAEVMNLLVNEKGICQMKPIIDGLRG